MNKRFDHLLQWLSEPANFAFALSVVGIVFTVVFWAITDRLEPSFVALFGTILTGSGLLQGRKAQNGSKPVEPEPAPDAVTEEASG